MISRTIQISAVILICLVIAGCGEDNPTTTPPPLLSSCDTCQAEILFSSKVNTSVLNGSEYVELAFTDSEHVFVGYRRGVTDNSDREMKIARSSNGGRTWIEEDVTPSDLGESGFTDPRIFLAATETQLVGAFNWSATSYPMTARILSTVDNGFSYSFVDQGNSCLTSALICHLGDCYGSLFSDRSSTIYLCGSMDGWLADCGLLRLRTDASAFDSVPSPNPHASFYACNNRLWAVAAMTVYYSSDRGSSWQTTGTLAPGESPLVASYAACEQGLFTVWLTPELGTYTMKGCHVSPDSIGGVQVIDTVQTYYEIPTYFYVRDSVVCMCTWRNQDPLYRTTDGGLTWQKHQIPTGLASVNDIPSALTWVNETTLYYARYVDGEIRFYCVGWEL